MMFIKAKNLMLLFVLLLVGHSHTFSNDSNTNTSFNNHLQNHHFSKSSSKLVSVERLFTLDTEDTEEEEELISSVKGFTAVNSTLFGQSDRLFFHFCSTKLVFFAKRSSRFVSRLFVLYSVYRI